MRRDYIATVRPEVDPGGNTRLVPNDPAGVAIIKVATTASCCNFQGVREFPEPFFQITKRFVAVMSGINVGHDDPRIATGPDGNVRLRPFGPPLSDTGLIGRCVL